MYFFKSFFVSIFFRFLSSLLSSLLFPDLSASCSICFFLYLAVSLFLLFRPFFLSGNAGFLFLCSSIPLSFCSAAFLLIDLPLHPF